MGGALDSIRGRDERGRLTRSLFGFYTQETQETKQDHQDASSDSNPPPAYASEVEQQAVGIENDEKEIEDRPDQVTAGAQQGQQKAEAVALVWSWPVVAAVYAWIWLCIFMLAFHSSINSNLINFVFSSFHKGPQVSTSYILANVVGGVLKLPISKTLNLWGRTEGLLVSVFVYVLGMIILAACNGSSAFAAGYVLYWIGYYCIYLILEIFVADTSGLRFRAFAYGFVQTPFIATAFTGPLAAQAIGTHQGWRWGYGIFCIVMPFVFCPLAIVFKYYEKKATKLGIYTPQKSGRTTMQSIVHYVHEFDVIGAFLLMVAFILFLLPFSLAQGGRSQYKSATFIAMLIVGFFMFFVFAAWEKWCARTQFIRYELLKDRTILGACVLSAVLYFSFDLWDQNFYNFIYITYDLEPAMAGYMLQIYNVGSCFFSPVIGVIIYATKRFKHIALFFGAPLIILGSGLMIYFRGQDHGIGYVVMCQIFIAFAGGTLVIANDMAAMTAGGREGTPMMLALLGLFNSVGGAFGLTVSAAIYNNVFPDALRSRLPDDLKSSAHRIWSDGIETHASFPVGSARRDAVNYAWGWAQRTNCIASTCILVLAIPAIAVWRNYSVDKKQNKGTMIF